MTVIALISRFFLISGDFHPEVDIDERIRRLQNDFGVDVLFTWGIIEQEGKNPSKIFWSSWTWNHMQMHLLSVFELTSDIFSTR